MSANLGARAAAERGKNHGRQRMPQRKASKSNHSDEVMKEATFDMGKVADAAQFISLWRRP